jgi:mono/diheme cytochrome c family protein
VKRPNRIWPVLTTFLAATARAGIARLRAQERNAASLPLDRSMPPWGAALLALPVLAAVVIGAAQYGQSQYEKASVARIITGGDPARAPWLLTKYGCGGCHTIGGVPGADGRVGPPLQELFERLYIGGTAENKVENLIAWITDATRFSPHTAMPPTGVTVAEARDIAAYLYTH